MKDSRRDKFWAVAGLFALALTVAVASARTLSRHSENAPLSAESDLHDAVASPMRPTAGLAGKPVPTSWFKTPEQHRAEMDTALLSSRRRRAAAAK